MESFSLAWFESLCQQLLSSSAQSNAVHQLEVFKDEDFAIPGQTINFIILGLLQSSTITDIAKFHGLTVLQYASIKKWDSIPPQTRRDVKETLQILLRHESSPPFSLRSNFTLNKLIQVYVSIWRRDWLTCDNKDHEKFFQYAESLLSLHDNSEVSIRCNIIGCMLLRTIVDAFSMKSSTESHYFPYDFHAQINKNFEQKYLSDVFFLSHKSLVRILSSFVHLQSNDIFVLYVKLVGEHLKLEIDILSWDFSDVFSYRSLTEKGNSTSCVQESHLYTLPSDWTTLLSTVEFLGALLNCYKYLEIQIKNPTYSVEASANRLEIQNLFAILASINFQSPAISPQGHALFLSNIVDVANSVFITINPNSDIRSFDDGGSRAPDLNLFCTTMHRLHNNVKLEHLMSLSKYEAAIFNLGAVTCSMAGELAAFADALLTSANEAIRTRDSRALSRLKEMSPFDSWRRDVLVTCLDIWAIILESLVNLADGSLGVGNTSGQQLLQSLAFRDWLRNTAKATFADVYRCATVTFLLDIVTSAAHGEDDDDELGEDEVEIESRSIDELLASFCTIGRTCFPDSVAMITVELRNALETASTLSSVPLQEGGKQCIEILERFRIGIIFLSHLCFENFSEAAMNSSGEVPAVHGLILPFLRAEVDQSYMNNMIGTMVNILMYQISLLEGGNGAHPLLSPLILKLLYRFFAEFVSRFIESDESVYSAENWAILQQFNTMNGYSFDSMVSMILSSGVKLLHRMPLELELVKNISDMYVVLSLSKRADRLARMVADPCIQDIVQILSRPYESSICRLNCDGLMHCYYAIGCLLVRSGSKQLFLQICTSIYTFEFSGDDARQYQLLERNISCLRGVLRVPIGFDDVLQPLLKSSLSLLRDRVKHFRDNEGVTNMYLTMLTDCAEHLISRLDNTACFELYKSSYEILEVYSSRFQSLDKTTLSNKSALLDTQAAQIVDVLSLLNNLSTKEFSFSEDYTEEISQSFEAEIAEVLLRGIEFITPLISIDILDGYPVMSVKYFSFIAFLTNAFFNRIVQWVYKKPQGQDFLVQLLQHLLWAVSCSSATVAKDSLQALQSIGSSQYRWMNLHFEMTSASSVLSTSQDGKEQARARSQLVHLQKQLKEIHGFDEQIQRAVLSPVVDMLMQVLLTPSTKSGGKAVSGVYGDRVDAFANTLITFIVLDPARFKQGTQYLVSQYPVAQQQHLLQSLTQLSAARGVQMTNISKRNRNIFVENFREFCVHLKSLSL